MGNNSSTPNNNIDNESSIIEVFSDKNIDEFFNENNNEQINDKNIQTDNEDEYQILLQKFNELEAGESLKSDEVSIWYNKYNKLFKEKQELENEYLNLQNKYNNLILNNDSDEIIRKILKKIN